jgi:superfamily II DNA helicase RecQ
MENDRTDKQKSEKLREEATKILEKCFGLNKFRKGQWEVIESILNHKNAIAIFPTGGGKSLCFQLPALMLPGTTIVISPLISLMKDQVDSLRERGMAASFISSSLSDYEVQRRLSKLTIVVFPAPVGPTRAMVSPAFTWKFTFVRTGFSGS